MTQFVPAHKWMCLLLVIVTIPAGAAAADAQTETLPASETLMQALVEECARSLTLQMEDLQKPYFVHFAADDSINYLLTASYGALTGSNVDRSRIFTVQTRVGSYELDNTNFSGGGRGGFFGRRGGRGGRRAALPLDDDLIALRQTMWFAADADYKNAVETLTAKLAYMKDKNIEDRPNDFSKASIVVHSDSTAELTFDRDAWEQRLKDISAQFKAYPQIQDSGVELYVGAGNTYVVNSEGTRLRTADTGALLVVTADLQAEDGMLLSGSKSYVGEQPRDLPEVDALHRDIDRLVEQLTQAASAPIQESYSGPVLFEPLAAAQVFRAMLADGIAGEPDIVGNQRRGGPGPRNLENKLGRRILPDGFNVHDDPNSRKFDDSFLFGHYSYDEEGVRAERVDLVVDGVLKNMVMSRVPTKKLSGSNGHARIASRGGNPQAAIANLFVTSDSGVSDEQLKAELIETVKEFGMDYGIRVASLQAPGIGSSRAQLMSIFMQPGAQQKILGDPVFAYRVYPDGHEEMIRGCEFVGVKIRDLKDILAAGDQPAVYNYIGYGPGGNTPPTAIISPAVLFEEMELAEIEQEYDKPPILKSPLKR